MTGLVDLARRVVDTAREQNVPFKAASISYYAIASVVPLLVIALAVLSVFGAADTLVEVLRASLSETQAEVLNEALAGTRGRSVAGVVGFLFTLWSASKVFRGLSIAFEELYAVGADRSLLGHVLVSLVVLGLLFLGVVLLSATSVALAYVSVPIQYPTLVGNVVATLVLAVAFLPLYYVLPPTSVTVRHALPGTAFAAVGWVLLQVAFFYYARNAGGYAAYGFLGAVLLFVTLLYFAAIVLLAGAVVNVEVERAG